MLQAHTHTTYHYQNIYVEIYLAFMIWGKTNNIIKYVKHKNLQSIDNIISPQIFTLVVKYIV